MILIEFTGAIDTLGSTRTFYLASEAFTTSPTDTPPDQEFLSRLIDPGAISLSIYTSGSGAISGGSAKLDIGEIIATNIDGEFDVLKSYSFDGRDIIVRSGDPGGDYPVDYPPILRASMESVDIGWDQLIIKVRDQTNIFNTPILTNRFGGTNALPNGIDGTADDLKGQIIPRIYGTVQQIAPKPVNTAKDTYRVSDGPVVDITQVNVRGEPMTRGVNYANSSDLQAAIVQPGEYQTCFAEGLFRLGQADGLVTADVVECPTEQQNASSLLSRLAIQAGVSSTRINQYDVANLLSLAPAPLGKYIDDESTYIDVMDQIAKSVGAWYCFDQLGNLRMGRLDDPLDNPLATLEKYEVIESGIQRSVITEIPVPLWSVTINHTPIGEVQTTDLATNLSSDRRAFLAQKYRSATSQQLDIKKQFLLAGSLTIDTLLMDADAAQAETLRKLNLHNKVHDLFTVPVPQSIASELLSAGLWLGNELAIDLDRFDLSGGKSFIVLGLDFQRRAQEVVFSLWRNNIPIVARFVTSTGIARGFVTVTGIAQDGSGIASAIGTASGLATVIGIGSTVGTNAGTGSPFGLLLDILKASQPGPSTAGFASGTATVTGVGVAIKAAVGNASGTGTAIGITPSGSSGRPVGLLLPITKP